MLDNPEKIARLMATLKAAVPFEVELPPSTLARAVQRVSCSARTIVSICSSMPTPFATDILWHSAGYHVGLVPHQASATAIDVLSCLEAL